MHYKMQNGYVSGNIIGIVTDFGDYTYLISTTIDA